MKKQMVSAVLAAAMLLGATGCKKEEKVDVSTQDLQMMDFNQYSDVDDVPSWEGESLSLVKWRDVNAPNTYRTNLTVSPDDVITPAFERVTGISIDQENSFDNAGGSYDSMIAKIIASDTYPDIANSLPDLQGLVDKGVLYRMDEAIEEYCPNLYKLFGPESKVFGGEWKRQIQNYGGVYALPITASPFEIESMVKLDGAYELTDEEVRKVTGVPDSDYAMFYMRDDILKQLYPEAHTYDELEKILAENGTYTEEEIFDVPLNSVQDFIDMLYDIKDLNLKQNGKTVYPIYSHNGSDNWGALVTASGLFGYGIANSMGSGSYFTYWDNEEKAVKYTFKEDWFKDVLKQWNQLVNDDVASKEAIVDTNSNFSEKAKNGEYAIVLNGHVNIASVNSAHSDFKYRPVYVKYTRDLNKFKAFGSDPTYLNKISVFNTRLNETQFLQVMRALEFAASKPGRKLSYWGPKSAGFYTESEDGKLQYTDEAVKQIMLTDNDPDKLKWKYGFDAEIFKIESSEYNPKLFYPTDKTVLNTFSAGLYHPADKALCVAPDLYKDDVLAANDSFANFWKAREAFETLLTKIFVAKDEAGFEASYKEMVDFAEEKGLDDAALEQFNEMYKTQISPDIME